MEIRLKRFLSLALAILMVFSMMPQITLGAKAATPGKLYLVPSSDWAQASARFAAYFFGNGEKWVSMTDSNKDGVYEVEVPSGYPSVIFCRMNPSASANNWDNKWNQSSDLTIPSNGNNLYVVKNGTWDKGAGTWSAYATRTIYYSGSLTHAYVWNKSANQPHTAWPGMKMTTVSDNLYSITVPTCYDMIIFSSNGSSQTADQTIPTNGNDYYNNGSWTKYVPHEHSYEYACSTECSTCDEGAREASHNFGENAEYCTYGCGEKNPNYVAPTEAPTEHKHDWSKKDGVCADATCGTKCEHEPKVVEVVAPDCENPGFTACVCTICGYEWAEDGEDATGHSFSDDAEFCKNGCGEKNPNYKEPVTYVAMVGEQGYETFDAALTAASAMTGDVVVEIYDKVTLNTPLSGSYDSIKFVGKDTDAEIYLDVQGYITATGKKVAFEDLTLSKSVGGFITNAGFMNVAFGIYDVAEVTYTDCIFTNGSYASSGEVTYTGCTFYRSHDKYGLWAYGDADITVDDCTFADYRGIKMYAENAAKTVDLTVKNTDFSAVNNKPAIVLTYGESVTLEGNTYSDTGVFELDLDGAPNGTPVTSDVAPTCKNDNGACGVLVDGKIYTTVADAVEAAKENSAVTVLYSTEEAAEFPVGTTITTATGVTAPNVTVAAPAVTYVAYIGEQGYETFEAAYAAAVSGDTITVLSNVELADGFTFDKSGVTLAKSAVDVYIVHKGGELKITDGIFEDVLNSNLTDGIVTVTGGTFNGANYFGGTMNISGGTFNGNMYAISGTALNISGGTFGGACVFTVVPTTISGGTFNGSLAGNPTVCTIIGGTFKNQLAGGSYANCIAEGYEEVQNADGTWTVQEIVVVPTQVEVATLAELQAALADNSNDLPIVVTEMIVIPEGTTAEIDLKGKTVKLADDVIGTNYIINNLGTLTLKDSVGGGSVSARGIYNGYDANGNNVSTAKITVESGTYNAKGTNGGAAIFNYGIAFINGGTFTSIASYSLNNREGAVMVIGDGVATASTESEIKVQGGIYNTGATLTVNEGNVSNSRSGAHTIYAWNSDVTINGGAIHNNNSGNSTIMSAGTSAVDIKNATVTINIVNASSSYLLDAQDTASYTISGGSFTGGIRAQGGTSYTISGGTFANEYGNYNVYTGGTVSISGGKFTSGYAKTFAAANLAEGYELTENADGTWGVALKEISGTITSCLIDLTDPAETFIASEIKNLYATESVVIKLFSGETQIATTTLLKPQYFEMATLGVKIIITGDSSSWETVWAEGMPRADLVPDKVVLFVDGKEMNSANVPMISTNGEKAVNWAEVPGVNPDPNAPVTYQVATFAELKAAVAAAKDGDIILMTADITSGEQLMIHKAVTLNLGGFTLTTTNGFGGLNLKNGPSVKNGTLKHTGNVAAIKAFNVAAIEDLVIDVAYTANKIKGGIVIQENSVGVGSIKNVTIKGDGLTNGIETYNCGNATEPVIGSMENVTIDAVGTAMNISAPCGTATNCSFTGGKTGIELWIKGTYSAELTLVGCTVEGGEQAAYVHDEFNSGNIQNNGELNLIADDATTFGAENGAPLTVTIARAENVDYTVIDKLIESAVATIGDTYYTSLQAAIEAVADGETITVLKDITFTTGANGSTNGISYTRGASFELDLNGKTVTSNLGGNALRFKIGDGNNVKNTEVTITVKNGKVISGSSNWCAISAATADNSGNKLTLNLLDLDVENYKAGDYAIKAWAGAVVNATGVDVTSSYGGSFHAVGGEMVLTDCTATQTGMHTEPYMSMAVAVSGKGKMTVNSGTYSTVPAAASDGYNQGASHGSWAAGVMSSGGSLVIKGGTFSNGNFGTDAATYPRDLLMIDAGGHLEIYGGTFNAQSKVIYLINNVGTSSLNPTAYVAGGIFSADPTDNSGYGAVEIPEGYEVVENANGTYTIEQVKVAQIGTEKFVSLEAAAAAAQAGDEIILLENVAENVTLPADITLNGNGKTVDGKITAGGDITISGTISINAIATGNNEIVFTGNAAITTGNVEIGGYETVNGEKAWHTNAKFTVASGASVDTTACAGFYGKHGATITVAQGATLTTSGKFQNNGDMTVYGTLNIENVSGDWLPKLAGTETATSSLGGSFTVDGGVVSVDAGWLTFGGGQGSAWVEATGAYTVNIVNGGKLTTTAAGFRNSAKSTLNIKNGTLEFTDPALVEWPTSTVFENNGIINVENSSVVIPATRKLTNNGSIVLADKTATLTSNECGNVTTTVADHKVVYENGTYKVVEMIYVAQIGDKKYESFEEALNAVADGETITLLGVTGSENKEIEYTKAISFTITGSAPEYALPVITFQNATVTIKDAEILIPELDARQNATINVVDSIVHDAGADSIVKSYYNGAINISGSSVVYTMQVTTMGTITLADTAKLNATWQTNVYGNGMITVKDEATFATAALHLTGKDYSGRDNTDADRVGKPATIVVDGANFIVGSVKSDNGADYSYNSGKGINIGTIAGKAAVLDILNGANVSIYMANGETANIGADGTVNVDGSTFTVACRGEGNVTLANNGTINVNGESTLNIPTLTGEESINLNNGAIVKDSTVGGNVFVAGKVIFRGDNTVGMIYDYGTLTDYYGTEANMEWSVEPGASLTITNKARYGLGYGDNITITGTLTDANLDNVTEEDRSFFTHGIVAQESKGWNCNSSLTVKDAYVTIGDNNSFGNKPGNYGGNYTFTFVNAAVDSSRITFYEALSKSTFTFTDSDVKTGTFMTRDADSVFTLTNTKLVSTTTFNGNDEGNYHAATLVLNNSSLSYAAPLVMENGTLTLGAGSSLTAPSITGTGKLIIDASGMTAGVVETISADASGYTGEIEVVGNEELYAAVVDGKIMLIQKIFAAKAGDKKYETFEAAIAAACADPSITRIEVLCDYVQTSIENTTSYYDIAQDLTIGAAQKVTVSGCDFALRLIGTGAKLTIEENVTIEGLNVVANGFATTGNNTTISGNIKALSLKQWTSNGTITITETGSVWLGYGDGQFDLAYGNGTVTVNGNGDKTAPQFKAGYSGSRGNGNTLNLNNTYFEAGAWFNVAGSNVTINVNNSLMTVSGGDSTGKLTIGETNVLNVGDGSEVKAGIITGSGKIVIDAANLTPGDAPVYGNASTFTGEIEVINSDMTAEIQNGKIVLIAPAYVAQIGTQGYKTLQAAVDAAQDGETVVLLDNITLTDSDINMVGNYKVMINVDDKSIELDMNGKNIAVDYNGGAHLIAVIRVGDNAGLTVTGNGSIDVADNGINVAYMFWKTGTTGYLTIENGTYHMDDAADSMVYTNGNQTVTVNGGTFTLDNIGTRSNGFPWIFNTHGQNTKKIVVNGGTFNCEITRQFYRFEVLVPETKVLRDNGDGTWTIAGDAVAFVSEIVGEYVYEVGYATLEEAVAAADNGETVTLLTDIEISQTLMLSNNSAFDKKNITIDGAGHTIKAVGTAWNDNTWMVDVAWNVVLKDLTFDANNTGSKGIQFYTSESTLNNVTIKNVSADKWGWTDYAIMANASMLTVEGALTFENCKHGHMIVDLGSATGKTESNVNVNNATLTGVNVALAHLNATLTGPAGMSVGSSLPGYVVVYKDGTYAHAMVVAKIGETGYASVQAALNAAVNGNTITLVADINENVTISKSVTIDGAGKNYTGNISVSGSSTAATVKNVNFIGGDGYAITTNRIKSITVENCTATGYTYGLLYANKTTPTVNVKDVTVSDVTYGVHWVYAGSGLGANLENVKMTNVTYGVVLQNYAAKTVTLKNCEISATYPIYVVERTAAVQTVKFVGANKLTDTDADTAISTYAKLVLTEVDATLEAAEGLKVVSGVEGMAAFFANGVYYLGTPVAQIGETYYESFEEALNAVADGETITLLGVTGSENKEIEYTKAISFTITGSAPEYALPVITFQNATVTIKDAEILIPELDARQNATINVVDSIVHDAGGNSIVKSYYNGAINISGSSVVYTMQVTTMGTITLADTAKLNATWQTNVYGNGMITVKDEATFATAALHLTGKDYSGRDNTDADRVGKPATIVVDGANFIVGSVKSDNGADYSYNSGKGINIGTIAGKAAVLDILNGANVSIYMANGETANIGADGTVNVNGSVNVVCRTAGGSATLTNNGSIVLNDVAATVTSNECGNVTTTVADHKVVYENGVYSVKHISYGMVAMIGEEYFETLADAVAVAQSGDTIVMIDDADIDALVLLKGVTLDLNGHNVEATGYAVIYAGNHVVDGATGGRLKGQYVMIDDENNALPIWDAATNGYAFADLQKFNEMTSQTDSNTIKYVFLPYLDAAEYDLLAQGAEISGVTLKIEASWTRDDGKTGSVIFNITDDLMKQFAEHYTTDRKTFSLTLTGVAGKEITFRAFFESETGVVFNCK